MKVVFDTNVLASAFVSEGVYSKLQGRARRGQIQLITGSFILKEFENVLLKRLSATPGETMQALRILAEAVSTLAKPSQTVSEICRAPDDDNILSCLITSGADYLLTGDSDLLELREFRGTRIVAPRDFELLMED